MRINELVTKLAISLFMWSVATCSFAGHIAEYIHMPLKGAGFAIDEETNSVIIEDVGYEAKFCDAKNSFYCVTSKAFEFALPKEPKLQDRWEYNGQVYKVIQRMKLRGERPALVIEKQGKPAIWYLWSSYRGLIMFGARQKAETQMGVLVLDGICGFAASDTCIEN